MGARQRLCVGSGSVHADGAHWERNARVDPGAIQDPNPGSLAATKLRLRLRFQTDAPILANKQYGHTFLGTTEATARACCRHRRARLLARRAPACEANVGGTSGEAEVGLGVGGVPGLADGV